MHIKYEESDLISESLLEGNVFPWGGSEILNKLEFSSSCEKNLNDFN